MDLVWLSEADLAEIKLRCEAATPGPWHSPGGATVALGSGYPHPSFSAASTMGAYDEDKRAVRKRKSVYPTQDDADFIAHSRTDVPRLIAALEAVTRERDEVQSERDGYDAALTLAVKGNTNSIREIHRLGAALATAEAKLAAVAALDTTWLNRFSDNKDG